MKCEAAVAILASKGLALVSVCRQHARNSFVPQCTIRFFLLVFKSNIVDASTKVVPHMANNAIVQEYGCTEG